MKIAIAGTGYVGLSNAILLAQHHEVTAVDVIPEKVDMVNRRESPIADAYIEDYLKHKNLSLTATLDGDSAYREAELIIIAAPTNYDDVTGHFDTKAVESILSQIQRVKSKALVISSLPSPSATPRRFPRGTPPFPSSLRRNFSGKGRRSMTTSILPALSSVFRRERNPFFRGPAFLRPSCRRGP